MVQDWRDNIVGFPTHPPWKVTGDAPKPPPSFDKLRMSGRATP